MRGASGAPVPDGGQTIEAARDAVMNLARDVQALSRRLHPARLDLLGIAAASAALCREISSLRALEIRFNAESVPDGLSRRVAVCFIPRAPGGSAERHQTQWRGKNGGVTLRRGR